MAFYIRKAFKTGPVRLNLSKGGLGISGGITGARVGINSRGTYVHGGRHGLYYRKYARKGKKRSAGGAGRAQPQGRRNQSGPVNLFVDTGVTFASESASVAERTASRSEPKLPEFKILNTPIEAALVLALIVFLFGVIGGMNILVIGALVVALAVLGWSVRELLWRKKVNESLDKILNHLEQKKTLPEIPLLKNSSLPGRWRERFSLHLHAAASELAMRDEEIDTLSVLQHMDDRVPADTDKTHRFRAKVFGEILDEMLEDHLLSEDEETAIRRLMDQLNLPEEILKAEQDRLEHFSRVRNEMERPLKTTDPGIPLLRGEEAYDVFENARILNERVLNRYQRDNVQYRELGYEIDMEGKLILTDRRLLLVERGSREYRLNRVLDLTVDPEAGITELTLNNRKSPVIISTENPLVFAARVEKVIEEIDA